jgi:hypothetical protein
MTPVVFLFFASAAAAAISVRAPAIVSDFFYATFALAMVVATRVNIRDATMPFVFMTFS